MIIQKPFEYTDLVLNKYVFIYYSRIFLLLVNIFVETVIHCCSIIWIMFVNFFLLFIFLQIWWSKNFVSLMLNTILMLLNIFGRNLWFNSLMEI